MRNFFKREPRRAAEFEEVERAERVFYLNYLRPEMTVFDVGANIGELTLMFSRFGGRVHAFEAVTETFKRLESICSAAKRQNVMLNNLAVSDQNGELTINIYDERMSEFNTQASRPLADYGIDQKPVSAETVTSVTIDDYCADNAIQNIDLLKIDVEGAELQVMRGAKLLLSAKRIRCLTFEFGQTTFDMGNTADDIEELLIGHGYKIRNIVDGNPTFPGRESVATARYSMHIATPA